MVYLKLFCYTSLEEEVRLSAEFLINLFRVQSSPSPPALIHPESPSNTKSGQQIIIIQRNLTKTGEIQPQNMDLGSCQLNKFSEYIFF